MGEFLEQVPEKVRLHLKQITKTSGLPDTEESVEAIAQAWLEKQRIFETQLLENSFQEVDEFAVDEERGAVLLTYSGSLLTVSPDDESGRSVEYVSIGLRQDVPESIGAENTGLSEDVEVDKVASFTNGPIEKSSAIYAIAVSTEDLPPDEEEELLSNMTQVLTEEFVEVNKTIILP